MLLKIDFNNPNPAALIPAMASPFSLDSYPYLARSFSTSELMFSSAAFNFSSYIPAMARNSSNLSIS